MEEKKVRRSMKAPRTRLATSIKTELVEELRAYAKQEGISMSLCLDAALAKWLKSKNKKVF